MPEAKNTTKTLEFLVVFVCHVTKASVYSISVTETLCLLNGNEDQNHLHYLLSCLLPLVSEFGFNSVICDVPSAERGNMGRSTLTGMLF